MLGLSHCYATLLAKEGITVNAINPALVETDIVLNKPNVRADMIPVERFGKPEEIAAVVILLARSGYVSVKPSVSTAGCILRNAGAS